jgi:urease accessory protein
MIIMGTIIMTTDGRSLLRLMAWLSPAFPVGGFAYSGGLEATVKEGRVRDASDLRDWLSTQLPNGALWNDAVLLAEAWKATNDPLRLAALIDLATALAGSAERHLEVTAQGAAFVAAASAWPSPVLDQVDGEVPYAVAVGAIAAANGVGLQQTLGAWLHAACAQSISAAIRLSVIGQRQGVEVLASLEDDILAVATSAMESTLDDLGSATVIADIMAMRHETLEVRLFRS